MEVRPHGWSLPHLTAALGSSKSLKWLLRRKLPVNGILEPSQSQWLMHLFCAARVVHLLQVKWLTVDELWAAYKGRQARYDS